MHKLLERVEKELENIADKGLSSSNLETTYKLIDIYKDIKERRVEFNYSPFLELDYFISIVVIRSPCSN